MQPEISEEDPQLRQIANMIPKFSFSKKNLWLVRWLMNFLRVPKSPADMLIENIFIPTQPPETKLRVRVYRPRWITAPTPALLWLHGGGYLIGKPEIDEAGCIQYARESGIVVVSVDYRCAPENPFPIPLEDSYAALQWVHSQAPQLGVDAARIAVGGASAGSGLAAALAQLAHDRRAIKPIFQLLIYPMLDDRTCTRTTRIPPGKLLWSQESNRFGWESYLGQNYGAANLPPYCVPARRADLAGLPPAWIGVGTRDLFHDEDVAYAQRLRECGVACELVIIPGAFHGFDVSAPHTRVVQDFRKSQIAALKRHLFPV